MRPNQVWAMAITYVPTAKGFVDLAVVLDRFSHRVLSSCRWRACGTTRLSITSYRRHASSMMEAAFCTETLEEAIASHGRPEVFNTDQGARFTCAAFINVLEKNGVQISIDGKGASMRSIAAP